MTATVCLVLLIAALLAVIAAVKADAGHVSISPAVVPIRTTAVSSRIGIIRAFVRDNGH